VAKKSSLHRERIAARKAADGITFAEVDRQNLAVCFFLVLMVFAVFGQTARFGFVNYDDDLNVYENPAVENGLSLNGIVWAFTHAQVNNWIPLTTLSHMADCQFFGLNAGGHHLVSVLLHAATAVTLFLMLRHMTGARWRSAFVAAVFAIHPLRAESVAWVSERKDVLSALFFMLTIGAYVRNVRHPSRPGRVAVIVLFALGLMAKSMVATLPLVLLLLDYWPLRRFNNSRQFARLLEEKIPLFALSVASCVAVVVMPGLIITDSDRLPLLERIENALVAYAVYMRQMVFPAGLAMPYPNPANGPPLGEVALAFVLLAVISSGAYACRKKQPFLLVGWLWYLGMLVPVIGIVQISSDASHADRYTCLPEIGLAMAATWATAECSTRWKYRRVVLAGLAVAVTGALMACASIQISYWKNSRSLWARALSCTVGNYIACNNLGIVFAKAGQAEPAIAQYRTALEIKPDYVEARNNLGVALARNGELDEAIAQYRKILETKPDYAEARNNLGIVLVTKGQVDEAIAQYRKALEIDPNGAEAHYNLGNALAMKGQGDEAIAQYLEALEIKPDYMVARNNLGIMLFQKGELNEAIEQYRAVLKLKPDYAEARNNLGAALMQAGRVSEAVGEYRQALETEPENVDALNNLAWLLATCPQASLRDGAKALALAQKAVRLAGGENPLRLRTLAAAEAETGRYPEAAATARTALRLAAAQGSTALAGTLQKEIQLYEAGTPFRDVKP
jgi:protein O-mannosyl-transferase